VTYQGITLVLTIFSLDISLERRLQGILPTACLSQTKNFKRSEDHTQSRYTEWKPVHIANKHGREKAAQNVLRPC
jgi:hypothetical protein